AGTAFLVSPQNEGQEADLFSGSFPLIHVTDSSSDQPTATMLVMAFDHPKYALLIAPVVVNAYHPALDKKNEQNGYFARLLDSDGRQLHQAAMNSTPVSDHGQLGKTFAVVQLPLLPQAAALQVVHVGKDGKEIELGKVSRSAVHPRVKII